MVESCNWKFYRIHGFSLLLVTIQTEEYSLAVSFQCRKFLMYKNVCKANYLNFKAQLWFLLLKGKIEDYTRLLKFVVFRCFSDSILNIFRLKISRSYFAWQRRDWKDWMHSLVKKNIPRRCIFRYNIDIFAARSL